MADLATREREWRDLTNASEKLGCKNLDVVAMNSSSVEAYTGRKIKALLLRGFVLGKLEA